MKSTSSRYVPGVAASVAFSSSAAVLNEPPRVAADLERQAARIDAVLRDSGYPLQDVHCRADGEGLVLIGQTTRYFHVQVALTLAMEHASGTRVVSEVDVIAPVPAVGYR